MNLQTKGISIHAPHEGERHNAEDSRSMGGTFQSTLPTRGSDAWRKNKTVLQHISIHAPHEGERLDTSTATPLRRDFNPRSPRGGATVSLLLPLPCRHLISIHAPHEGERPRRRDT